MKKLFLFLSLGLTAMAQQNPRQSNITGMKVLGQAVAAEFGRWSMISRGNVGSGVQTITLELSSFLVPDGMSIMPITTSNPITIIDGPNTEIVTPSTVNCSPGSGICNFTATLAHTHLNNFSLGSGTHGLQEAINEMSQSGGMVIITPDWSGSTGLITAATGAANVSIWDTRSGSINFYIWNGSVYQIGWGVNVNGGLTPTTISSVSVINKVRYTNAFAGSDFRARFLAAQSDLPSTGGIISAVGEEGVKPFSATITFTKPITLIVGATTLRSTNASGPAFVGYPGSMMIGSGIGVSIIQVAADGANADGIQPAQDMVITGFTLQGNITHSDGASAFDGCNCTGVKILNNRITGWGGHGGNTGGGPAAHWEVAGNRIDNNHDDGFLFGGAGHHSAHNNWVEANGSNGLDYNSPDQQIYDNDVIGNGTVYYPLQGFDCSGILGSAVQSNADNGIIVNNRVRDNLCFGIQIQPTDTMYTINNTTIATNIVTGSLHAPQIAVDTSAPSCGNAAGTMIYGNQVTGGASHGIAVGGGTPGIGCVITGTQIKNNSVTGNVGTGLFVAYGTDAEVKNNTSTGNGTATNYSGSTNTSAFCNKTSTNSSICALESGVLATNSFQPASGVRTTLTSTGNTEFKLDSTGIGQRSYSLLLDQFGNFVIYDNIAAVPRFTIDSTGATTVVGNTLIGATVIQANSGFRLNGTTGPYIVAATGDPVGACPSGSIYLKTDGDATHTLWICVAASWINK